MPLHNAPTASLAVFCDQSVDIHFPAHFHKVYGQLLPESGIETTTVAYCRNCNSDAARRLSESGVVLMRKPLIHNLLQRISFATTNILRLFGLLTRHKAIRNAQVYMVHNDPLTCLIFYGWARIRRRRVIYRITHLMAEELQASSSRQRRITGAVAKYLRNWLIKHCDHVYSMSSEMRDYLEQITGHAPVTALPSVVDMQQPTEPASTRCQASVQSVDAKMSQISCDVWLVYLGTLSPGREPGFLMDVLAKTREKGHNAGLVILGISNRPEDEQALRTYAADSGMAPWIAWCKPVPEQCLGLVLKKMHVGLSPFPCNAVMRHNSPLKTLEYLRAGLPVVGTPIRDHLEVIKEPGTGLVAEHHPQAFASAIDKLLNHDQETHDQYARNAAIWLRKNRSLETARDIIAATLDSTP